MAANNILAFGGAATTEMTQAAYLATSQRTNGNQPGIADQLLVNKAMHQMSLMATALAQFIADRQPTDVSDTLTPVQVAALLAQSLAGIRVITATTALTSADVLKYITSVTASNITVTLPPSAGLPDGFYVDVAAQNSGNVTVTATGASIYFLGNPSPVTPVLRTGSYARFVWFSNQWNVINGPAQLGSSYEFGSSLASPGWQRLPSGLMLQWGAVLLTGVSDLSISYPIAYSISPYITVATVTGSYATSTVVNIDTQTASSFAARVRNQAGSVTGAAINWYSIGKA